MEDDNMIKATIINENKDVYFDNRYFNSYDSHHIHAEMLSDKVRTIAYRKAILNNPQLFEGKTVLDVGCGTGILSMFAAQAGAKHVFSIDYSSIAESAKEIVALNGFSDVITVIRSKMEDVVLPCKVDVIISEWMGYALLYEAMLGSVIYARDTWLAPNGVILPDKAIMYLGGIEDADYKESKIEFWNDVYGFDMSIMKSKAMVEALVDVVNGDQICTSFSKLIEIDMMTVSRAELDFTANYAIKMTRNDYVHAFVLYFDVIFGLGHTPIVFSTAPSSEYTHWKQTVFYLDQALTLSKDEFVTGQFTVNARTDNERDLDFKISYSANKTYPKLTQLSHKKGKKSVPIDIPANTQSTYSGTNGYVMR